MQTIETRIPGRLDRLPWSRFHWRVVIGLSDFMSRVQPPVVQRSILEWDVCPLGCPYLQEGF